MTFAHIRAPSGAPDIFLNCHPFRQGPWFFMHKGQIGGFAQIRRYPTSLLTDASFAALQGGTDSELILQSMVSHGLESDPAAALRRVTTTIEEERQKAGIEEAFRATFALSDGWRFWAVRWASDAQPPTLYGTAGEGYDLLVSEPLDEDIDRWKAIEPNSPMEIELATDWSRQITTELSSGAPLSSAAAAGERPIQGLGFRFLGLQVPNPQSWCKWLRRLSRSGRAMVWLLDPRCLPMRPPTSTVRPFSRWRTARGLE